MAEALCAAQYVLPVRDVGGAKELPLQKARREMEARRLAKSKSLAGASSMSDLMTKDWKNMPLGAEGMMAKKEGKEGAPQRKETKAQQESGQARRKEGASLASGSSTKRPYGEEPTGVHPWRPGTAVRLPYRRGSAKGLDNVKEDAAVINRLVLAKFATSSMGSTRSRTRWWTQRCASRKWAVVPVTVEKLELAAALLKEGGYRSACLYLATIKRLHVQAGYKWTQQLNLEMADAKRAVNRGRGPDRQADPLPLDEIGELTEEQVEAARREYWPAAGREAAVVCCAWLVREVEASTAFEGAVTLRLGGDKECDWATWDLPASKADWLALGKQRALGCACPAALCPAAAMRKVLRTARQENKGRTKDVRGGPLFPKLGGDPLTKKEMAAFFNDLANAAGVSDRRITGHSARATGAMRMALAGHGLPKIKVFGRWGSAAVERYVREAILGRKGGNISKVTEGVAEELEEKKPKRKAVQAVTKGRGRGRRLKRVEDDDEEVEAWRDVD